MNIKEIAARLGKRSVSTASGCIEWTGCLAGGYGNIRVDGRMQYTHRLAWGAVHGPIPDGLFVLHKCDNPKCLNVDHLFLGTKSDNAKDMYAKGRQGIKDWKGQNHPRAKLTTAQVLEARRRRAAGEKIKDIAADMGVVDNLITRICNGTRWAHVR